VLPVPAGLDQPGLARGKHASNDRESRQRWHCTWVRGIRPGLSGGVPGRGRHPLGSGARDGVEFREKVVIDRGGGGGCPVGLEVRRWGSIVPPECTVAPTPT